MLTYGAGLDLDSRPAVYRRRRPEQSVLHRLVRENLETFLDLARQDDAAFEPVPPFVETTFRKYLECSILGHGSVRDPRLSPRGSLHQHMAALSSLR